MLGNYFKGLITNAINLSKLDFKSKVNNKRVQKSEYYKSIQTGF